MTKDDKIQLSLNIAVISAVIALVMSVVLLLNYWQVSNNDPLESEALKVLVERSFENPKDEALKQDVRRLDLLARKAFFTSKWQIKTGSYILLFSAIMLIISLRLYYSLTEKIVAPGKNNRNDYMRGLQSQKWILAIGGLVLVFALLAGYFTKSHLNDYIPESEKALSLSDEEDTNGSEIEVIEITMDSSLTPSEGVVQQDSSTSGLKQIDSTEAIVKSQAETKKTIAPYPTAKEIESNFSSFRGPWANGISKHKNIPTSWDGNTNKNILWKTEIPKHGYNSPVIWEDKIFLAGGDKESRVVYCLSKKDGKILWQREVKNVPGSTGKMPNTTDDTGLSAASVATDGRRVYAIFANGDLIAFDMDGKELWSKNFGVPDNHYGHSSSLISWKDQLFVQYDSNRGGKLFSINVHSGAIVWQTVRKCKISWASPILVDINGKKQLILASNPIVAGYDITNGKELWQLDCLYGEVGPSAGYGAGLIFAANEYAKLVAIDPADNYKIKWEDDEYLPEVSSPVVSKGLLYIATSYGALVCYNAVSGERLWEKEYDNGFYSSPIIVDNKLYAIDMGGIMHIIAITKEFKLIAEPKLNEKIVTTPAFSDGRIYIRGDKYLYCIGK